MAKPEIVKIRLFGTEYDIASAVDVDYVQRIGRYVDEKMHEIAKSLSLRSVSTIAVLTAVNLADELRREIDSNERLDQAASASADRLSDLIDQVDRIDHSGRVQEPAR